MSSVTEQRLSMDELKQRNRPATTWNPSQEEWEELLNTLDKQTALLRDISKKSANYPTRNQIEELTRSVQALRQTVEQAGRKKEKSFSLPKIKRPEIHLNQDSLIKLVVVLGFLLGLCVMCYASGQIWEVIQPLFQ